MRWLYEDSSTLLWVGGVAQLLLAAVLVVTRRKVWLVPMAIVLLLVAAGVVVERWVQTPRERVLATLHEGSRAFEANEAERIFACVDPQSHATRAEVETLLSELQFEEVRLKNIEIVFNDLASPPSARANFLVSLRISGRRQAVPYERVLRQVSVTLVERQGRWLATGFEDRGPPRL